jgi:hypothetical protein
MFMCVRACARPYIVGKRRHDICRHMNKMDDQASAKSSISALYVFVCLCVCVCMYMYLRTDTNVCIRIILTYTIIIHANSLVHFLLVIRLRHLFFIFYF